MASGVTTHFLNHLKRNLDTSTLHQMTITTQNNVTSCSFEAE